MTVAAIGVDVGGTNVRVAGVTATGAVVSHARTATSHDLSSLVDSIVTLVAAYPAHVPVGVGVAGGVDADGLLRFGPNLGMPDAPIGPALVDGLRRPVALGNDATLATYAEHRVGAGAGVDDLVLLTLGTGVGGGIISGGRLVAGAHGLGSEVGHMIVAAGGRACPCGARGCLEAYASGRAMALDDRDGGEVVASAHAGDDVARAHIADAGCWLGVGIASLVALLDPALVLVGGGAGHAAFDLLHPAATAALDERLIGRGHRPAPPIVRAALGDDAGVVGAALHALEELSP